MVLYTNVCLNQRVEIKECGQIYQGTVKYKGPLVTQHGDWVGIAVDLPVGKHDGLYKARRYFSCKPGHGIFTSANKIRFIPLTRCLYNRYHTVDRASFVDETLFSRSQTPEIKSPYGPVAFSGAYNEMDRGVFTDESQRAWSAIPKSYRLPHTVGNHIPAATMKRPHTAHAPFSYRSSPVHAEYLYEDEPEFVSSPSIPKCHMPHDALVRQVRRGWANSHYVREMSVPTGRESIKMAQWNDISA